MKLLLRFIKTFTLSLRGAKRLRGIAEANSELAVQKSQGPWSNLRVKEIPRCSRNRLRNLNKAHKLHDEIASLTLAMTTF